MSSYSNSAALFTRQPTGPSLRPHSASSPAKASASSRSQPTVAAFTPRAAISFASCLGVVLRTMVVDGHVPAVVGQSDRDRTADPPAGTGHQCHLLLALDLSHPGPQMQRSPAAILNSCAGALLNGDCSPTAPRHRTVQALPLNRFAPNCPSLPTTHGDTAIGWSKRSVAEIERHGGWISFTRYMEMALYAPGLGYYVAGAAKLGGEGDFVTGAGNFAVVRPDARAPGCRDSSRTPEASVLELGAGSGTLAADAAGRTAQARNCLPERYRILEVSPELVQRQRRLLQQRLPGLADRVEWITSLPPHFTGVVVANEVLDALPVHLLAWQRGRRMSNVA